MSIARETTATQPKGTIERQAEMYESAARGHWLSGHAMEARYSEGKAAGLRLALELVSGFGEGGESP